MSIMLGKSPCLLWVVVVNIHGKLSDLRINTIVDASSVWPEVLLCIAETQQGH